MSKVLIIVVNSLLYILHFEDGVESANKDQPYFKWLRSRCSPTVTPTDAMLG